MVRRFYQDVAQDDLLGPVFNDVAQVDWVEHLPKLTLFWCRALLGMEGYVGNPFRSHARHGAGAMSSPRQGGRSQPSVVRGVAGQEGFDPGHRNP